MQPGGKPDERPPIEMPSEKPDEKPNNEKPDNKKPEPTIVIDSQSPLRPAASAHLAQAPGGCKPAAAKAQPAEHGVPGEGVQDEKKQEADSLDDNFLDDFFDDQDDQSGDEAKAKKQKTTDDTGQVENSSFDSLMSAPPPDFKWL